MAQSPVLYRKQHGWETTSADYHVHVSRMERMPSVLPDVPRYPSVFKAFHNGSSTIVEEEPEIIHEKQQQATTKPVQKVHLVEKEEIIPRENSQVIVEENIDTETEGFLQQKRRGFELCKWRTFKML